MRDIDRGLGDGRLHVHDGLVFALVRAGEQLDAVEADLHIVRAPSPPPAPALPPRVVALPASRRDGRPSGKCCRRGRYWDRGLHPHRRGGAAASSSVGSEPRSHTVVKPHRVSISCMCAVERRRRRAAGVPPHGFREMDVAVPEAGHDRLAGAIDHARIGRDLHVAAAADRGDDAVGRDDDRIVERRGVRRRVDLAAHERERLRIGRYASRQPPQAGHGRARRGTDFQSWVDLNREDTAEPYAKSAPPV